MILNTQAIEKIHFFLFSNISRLFATKLFHLLVDLYILYTYFNTFCAWIWALRHNKEPINFPTVLKDMPLLLSFSFSGLDGILLFRIITGFITFILCSYKYHSLIVNLFSEANIQGILFPHCDGS